MQDRFALLLKGFSALAARGNNPVAPCTGRIRTLLKEFGERRDRADTSEQEQLANEREHMRVLLDGYNKTIEKYLQQQEEFAEDFNLLRSNRSRMV